MAFAILVLFAVRTLGMSPGLIGLVFALGNLGFLLGAVTSRRIVERLGVGATIVGAAVVFGVAGLLVPLASRSTAIPLLTASIALFGFGGVVYNINQVSLRQAITPLRMQGRMNATMRFMVWGTMPIGAFVGGVLGKAIGLRPTLWIAAIGGLMCFVFPAVSPVRTLERIPEMSEDEPIPASIPGPIPTGS
jgi:MFS family permease